MDFSSLTFVGLATLGFVNVVGFFFPSLPSAHKFGLSVVAAFVLSFVPLEIGNMLYDKAVAAIEIALAASGGYKLAQKMGSN